MTAEDIVELVAKANSRGPTSGFTDIADDAHEFPPGFDTTSATIFKPLKVGDITLQHRVIHAALGRARSANDTESPLAAKYFAQRTTPGALMISQATGISPESAAWPWAAVLRNEEQQEALIKIIQAVHAKGGFWFQQLFHVGRCTSPALVKRARQRAGLPEPPPYGYLPVSASAVAESGINTHSGEPFGVPHALTVDELRALRDDYKRTAQIAFEAGADGIEILSGNGFLLDQFLHDNINQRTDEYGGNVENRSRFPLEVIDAVAEVTGYQRIGVRLSPFSNFHETDGSQPVEQALHISRELARRGVAYLHIGEARVSRNLGIEENLARLIAKGIPPESLTLEPFRRLLDETPPSTPGHTPTALIGAGGYTAVSGVLTVEEGKADAVAYGRRFISNPDLVQRLRLRQPLTPYDRDTFYSHGAKGYTSYRNHKPDSQDSIAATPETTLLDDEGAPPNSYASTNGTNRTDGTNSTDRTNGKAKIPRVAIIGAGVSGILTASAFQRLGGFHLQIYERRPGPGGVWVYDKKSTSVPQFPGEEPLVVDAPVPRPHVTLPATLPRLQQQRFTSSPIYKTLEANIPYNVMSQYTSIKLPPPEHGIHPFLTGEDISTAIRQTATDYSHLIQCSTTVEDVEKRSAGGLKLLLRRENPDGTDTWYEEIYDHLVVATGHNSVPRVPNIPGLTTWKGSLQHATTWRSGEDYSGQRILVVGSSESAIDIVLQSLPHVKGPIYVSQRSPHPRYPTVFNRPGVKIVSTIDRFTEDEIHLSDGTVVRDIDTVVFATGYFYTYPFLSKVRPLQPQGGLRVPGLYQHIFDIYNPDTIAFVGVANLSLTWLTWEKSAFLLALFWAGKIRLPPREVQEAWEASRLEDKGSRLFHLLELPHERVIYFDELNELAADYLHQEDSDDELLRSFPADWIVNLLSSRWWKLKKYGISEEGQDGLIEQL